MSIAWLFVCDGCAHEVVAWADGNPYYIDSDGEKRHAWHPDHELLELCIAVDVPHLCLKCCEEFDVDSRAPSDRCPVCFAREIVDLLELQGVGCPWCKAGTLSAKPGFYAIS